MFLAIAHAGTLAQAARELGVKVSTVHIAASRCDFPAGHRVLVYMIRGDMQARGKS